MHNDELDGVLFRFWIRMAADQPGATAIALMACTTADDYRQALRKLAKQLKINLPTTGD